MTAPTPPANSEHESVRRRLVAYASGLLAESEEAELLEHVRTCESCRAVLERSRDSASWRTPPGDHIAPGLLSAWPRTSAALRGLEREAVERHLERCELCREELMTLGHEPALAIPGVRIRAVEKQPMSQPELRRVELAPRPWMDRARWALGGWATIATAAAAWLFVARPAPEIVDRIIPVPTPVESPARIEVLSSDPLAGLERFPEHDRGSASSSRARPTYVTSGAVQTIFLPPPPTLLTDPAAEVRLEIISPTDSLVASLPTSGRALLRARAIPFTSSLSGFSTGVHVMRVRSESLRPYLNGSDHEDFEFAIVLRK